MTSAELAGANVSGPRREQRAWYVYDWAISAFSTTVIAVFIGPYLTNVAQSAAGPDGRVRLFGLAVPAEAFYPYVVSASVLVQVLLLPVVGAVADRSPHKKRLLGSLAYLGALAAMGLYFVRGDDYLLGGALLVVANVALGCSVVVYNSFLLHIAGPDERDAVSARGWAAGYIGGGLLLAANLGLFLRHEALGLSEGEAVRVSLLSAGIWWAVFTAVPLAGLRDPARPAAGEATTARTSLRQLAGTLAEARKYPQTLLFLGAYLLYNDGIQTVVALSSTYGAEELRLPQTVLIVAILLVQFVAFGGALLFGSLARVFGAKRLVLASLVLWSVVVAAAYLLRPGALVPFFALATGIGIVLGGSQALSRSLFSQLIPRDREAQYFGLYEVGERGTAWIGTVAFGLALSWTGSYRVAILSLVVFFVAGLVLLARVNVARGMHQAGNPIPSRRHS